MPSNHLILCHPLLFLPSIFPSIRVFSNELALPIMLPKYWSFTFSICPSNEYSGLIPLGNLVQHKDHVKFLSTCTQATPNKHGYLVKKERKKYYFYCACCKCNYIDRFLNRFYHLPDRKFHVPIGVKDCQSNSMA